MGKWLKLIFFLFLIVLAINTTVNLIERAVTHQPLGELPGVLTDHLASTLLVFALVLGLPRLLRWLRAK